ncbi:MAG: hypothetical protein QOD06_1718 [Candidatus Binatota bacterium]|nr:hypothetical protein [Candidatus Binatota bacterium]
MPVHSKFEWLGAVIDTKRSHERLASGLEFLWLEITSKCNLVCVHCYTSSTPHLPLFGAMTMADWRRVLEDGRALGCERVEFIGGEPTLHPGLPDLLDHAGTLGYPFIELYTNGTVMTEELLAALVRNRVGIEFSIYGDRSKEHDAVTLRAGSFRKTLANVKRAIRAGVPVKAGFIKTGANDRRYEATERLLERLGVYVSWNRVAPTGRGADLTPGPERLCGQCWRGRLAIDAQGTAFPCVFARSMPMGNVRRDGLRAVVSGDSLAAFRGEQFRSELERTERAKRARQAAQPRASA